ncbi:hypothetical protein ACL02U_27890 [Streptomyces sp. MS06]|uniref:hypothetical protein n=1 Tax=Streptomyces sp. MS06 TaxID=3385974 RepID=UPI0039A3137D
MRAIRVASAALLGVGALSLAAPAAVATSDHDVTPFGFSVEPSTIAAGGQVRLRLERDDGGCKGAATVTSGVFDTVTIPRHRSTATARVDRDARPGAVYEVTFTCDRVSGSTPLTIAGGHSTELTPVPRGVHAGQGGSVAGFDLGRIGLGAALVTASVGAAYRLVRRRSGDGAA